MSERKIIAKPERNQPLIRFLSRAYWEATGEHWYPEKRAIKYVLCRLGQEYDISEKDNPTLRRGVEKER